MQLEISYGLNQNEKVDFLWKSGHHHRSNTPLCVIEKGLNLIVCKHDSQVLLVF